MYRPKGTDNFLFAKVCVCFKKMLLVKKVGTVGALVSDYKFTVKSDPDPN